MILYHGTSEVYLNKILEKGLVPRKDQKIPNSNWKEYPSQTNMIYLSTAYPFYFAYTACDQVNQSKGVVFELDLPDDSTSFYPDEDFIYHCIKNRYKDKYNTSKEALKQLHEDIKNNLQSYQHYWGHSITKMGVCSYKETITPEHIKRYCVVDFRKTPHIALSCLDPSISPDNFAIKGKYYQDLVKWFFGDRELLPQVDEANLIVKLFQENKKEFEKGVNFWTEQSYNREYIQVINL